MLCFFSVADPSDPYVFGPLGSGSGSNSQKYGSGSFYPQAKIGKKNLDSYCFVLLFDFLSVKKDVNVPKNSNKQKNKKTNLFLFAS